MICWQQHDECTWILNSCHQSLRVFGQFPRSKQLGILVAKRFKPGCRIATYPGCPVMSDLLHDVPLPGTTCPGDPNVPSFCLKRKNCKNNNYYYTSVDSCGAEMVSHSPRHRCHYHSLSAVNDRTFPVAAAPMKNGLPKHITSAPSMDVSHTSSAYFSPFPLPAPHCTESLHWHHVILDTRIFFVTFYYITVSVKNGVCSNSLKLLLLHEGLQRLSSSESQAFRLHTEKAKLSNLMKL